MPGPSNKLTRALEAYSSGRLNEARRLCLSLPRKEKLSLDALHLQAVIEKKDFQFDRAEYFFKKCLSLDSKHSHIYSNYANLLLDMGREYEAIKIYHLAVKVDKANKSAWFNLAVVYERRQEYEYGLAAITTALNLDTKNTNYHIAKAKIHANLEQFEQAWSHLVEAENFGADPVKIIQHKAGFLRLMEKPDQALSMCIEKKNLELATSPDVLFLRGCCEYDLGKADACEQSLNLVLQKAPSFLPAHEALNKLLWELGREEEFLGSYKNVLNKTSSLEFRIAYISQCILAQYYELAESLLDELLGQHAQHPVLFQFKGVVLSRAGQHTKAAIYFRKALDLMPYSIRYLIDNASIYIREEKYKSADSLLARAAKIDPIDQEVWAYRGLSWRLQGDERFEWLTNYDLLVKEFELGIPDGYDDQEHFLFELSKLVAELHVTERQPLDQSVVGGTQTIGRFLARENKVIQAYKAMLNLNIKKYLSSLPQDDEHPFLSRNQQLYALNGSWSVRLREGGYHSNHVHPVGWLSNCTYLQIPSSVSKSDTMRSGWIKFGQTSLELGERESIDKSICPRPGHHVLFPSYLWHGTEPFKSDDFRTTLPNDIRPVPILN